MAGGGAAITGRSSATVVAAAVLAVVLAVLAATPASASHLNYFRGRDCTGGIMATCFDGSRCGVPNGALSFQFLHLPGWNGYIFNNPTCAGTTRNVLAGDVRCRNGFNNFQCVKITDRTPTLLEMATDE